MHNWLTFSKNFIKACQRYRRNSTTDGRTDAARTDRRTTWKHNASAAPFRPTGEERKQKCANANRELERGVPVGYYFRCADSNVIDFIFAFERKRAALRHFDLKDIKVYAANWRWPQKRSEERFPGVFSRPQNETLRHLATILTAMSGSLPANSVAT